MIPRSRSSFTETPRGFSGSTEDIRPHQPGPYLGVRQGSRPTLSLSGVRHTGPQRIRGERLCGYTRKDATSEHSVPSFACSFRVVCESMDSPCHWHTQDERFIRPYRLCEATRSREREVSADGATSFARCAGERGHRERCGYRRRSRARSNRCWKARVRAIPRHPRTERVPRRSASRRLRRRGPHG